VPVDEEWFIKTIAGKHNDDIASALFPDDQERGLKFCDEKEAMFRRFGTPCLCISIDLVLLIHIFNFIPPVS